MLDVAALLLEFPSSILFAVARLQVFVCVWCVCVGVCACVYVCVCVCVNVFVCIIVTRIFSYFAMRGHVWLSQGRL